jgi:hypothetical protein
MAGKKKKSKWFNCRQNVMRREQRDKETLYIPSWLFGTFHGDDRLEVLLALLGREAAIVAVGSVGVGV